MINLDASSIKEGTYLQDSASPQCEGLKIRDSNLMNPWFLTGFVDGEGCFRISLTKRDNLVGWRVQLFFQITLHRKDKTLLENIQKYWKVGKIHKSGSDLLQYRIQSFVEIETIIKHLDKGGREVPSRPASLQGGGPLPPFFPLISQKRSDYELFKSAYNLVLNKEHLTYKGLHKIVALRASCPASLQGNWGLPEQLKTAFPDVVPIGRPLVPCQKIQDANWLAGFATAEGCFMVLISQSKSITVAVRLFTFVLPLLRKDKSKNKRRAALAPQAEGFRYI